MQQIEKMELIFKCKQKVQQVYSLPIHDLPKIVWNDKMRSTAGKIWYNRGIIELNPHLLDTPEKLESTLMHELAHFVAYCNYESRGHGKLWKKVMVELGQKPDRCHSYDTSQVKRKMKKYKVSCKCDFKTVTKHLLTKMKKGQNYRCGKCKVRIDFQNATLVN